MFRPTAQDGINFLRGFFMGSADIVPGVSGGTVALILGIYQRLVGAISRCDAQLLRLLVSRAWADAARRVDLRFLVALGAGVLSGIAMLATFMQYLLDEQRSYTLAVFFGLIAASSIVVAKMVRPDSERQMLACIVGGVLAAGFALWLVSLSAFNAPPDSLAYFFFCGMAAICAMILPGVSGAFLLLLFGIYDDVTDVIRAALHMEASAGDLATLVVFACGCAVGLMGFSKLLRRLLERAHAVTMAVLCGFMVGSLRKLWPFQAALNPQAELKHRIYENVAPVDVAAVVWQFIVPAAIALTLVLLIERMATMRAEG